MSTNRYAFCRYSDRCPRYGYWEERDIVVIDGRCFYRSTGNNSKHPGLLFPFLYLKDTTHQPDFQNAPAMYNQSYMLAIHRGRDVQGYLFKFTRSTLESKNLGEEKLVLDRILDGRVVLRSSLLTMDRLNRSGVRKVLPKEKIQQLCEVKEDLDAIPELHLDAKPLFETSDVTLINCWIRLQGGSPAKEVLPMTRKGLMNWVMTLRPEDCTLEHFKLALNEYKEVRNAEGSGWGIFKRTDKVDAVDKLLKFLVSPQAGFVFEGVELNALHNKDLGKIVKKFKDRLPENFNSIYASDQHVHRIEIKSAALPRSVA
jgi:hypothetical protein